MPQEAENRRKAEVHDAIAAWAGEMAGTDLDLDPDLESAGIEHLLESDWNEVGLQPGKSVNRRRGNI